MNIKNGTIPVGNSQKVGDKVKQPENQGPFTVSWHQTSAKIGQTVKISGTINIVVKDTSKITVKVLFNDKPYLAAEEVKIQGTKITAQWTVTPFSVGTFTSGKYDVEVRLEGISGKTRDSLRIVSAVNHNVSSFG